MPMFVVDAKVTNIMRFYITADTEAEAEELAYEAPDCGDLISELYFEVQDIKELKKN